MADTSNRLMVGAAVGLLSAAGLLASGILSDDGGGTATDGIEQASDLPALTASDGESPLALADQSAPGDESTGRPAALLVVAPESLGGDQGEEQATTSSTIAPSTSTTAAPAPPTTEESESTDGSGDDSGSSSPTSVPASTTAPPTTPAPSGDGADFEQQVIDLTNAERQKAGCPALANNSKLGAAALGHSTDMATKGYFSHTGANGSSMRDRVEAQGYSWRSLAENIAAGYRTAQAVVTGWMNSSGHRANILNCDLTEIGVGFHDYHWTQNFGTPG